MSDFVEGQSVIISYDGKRGTVVRESESTVVVQQGDRTLYLKKNEVKPA